MNNNPFKYLEFTESFYENYEGFNYELHRFTRNRCGFYHIEYRLRRTIYQYKYFDLRIFDRNIYTETAWINTIDYDDKCKYNIFHYKMVNRKEVDRRISEPRVAASIPRPRRRIYILYCQFHRFKKICPGGGKAVPYASRITGHGSR